MDDITLSPDMVDAIRSQIRRQLTQQVGQIVEQAVADAFNPQAVAARSLRLEENATAARATR
jgi:hypothetical protein